MPAPALVQHFASPCNPAGFSPAGDNYTYTPFNAVGQGNCGVLKFSYPNGNTPTVTATNGNTFTLAKSVDAGGGGMVAASYVAKNMNAGKSQFQISFGATIQPVQITYTEYCGIDTVSPVNGTSGIAQVQGASLAAGSFTPGLNDASGGNIIDAYFALSNNASTNPTNWVPGAGTGGSGSFILLDGDIAWVNNIGFPHASQYFLQTAQTPINPGITATGDTADFYNCVAIALKVDTTKGTAAPAGIYVNRMIVMNSQFAGTPTWKLKCPSIGNLRVLLVAANTSIVDVTGITDNDTGSSWALLQSPDNGASQIWYSPNRAAKNDLDITLSNSSTFAAGGCVRFFDISGALASPVDVFSGTSNTSISGVATVINDQPVITPTFIGSWLALAILGLGQGPATGLASGAPVSAGFDVTDFTNRPDNDLMTDADGCAHLYGSGAGTALHWNYNITVIPSGNTGFSQAAVFKAAPIITPPISSVPFGIIGLGSSEW